MESFLTDQPYLPESKAELGDWFLNRLANALDPEPIVDELPPGVVLWAPFEGKPQEDAYYSLADELYYGGGGGGGKTDLALGLSVTAHKRSLILRREAVQLTSMIERSKEILAGFTDHFNSTTKVWRGLPGGRMIEFGGCQLLKDREAYQGQPHDLIVFDEAPQFLLLQVVFIIGWNRTNLPGQRVRVVYTGNPPTDTEGEWIIERFAPWLHPDYKGTRARPGELRWFAAIDGVDTEVDGPTPFMHGDELIQPLSRTFIPARVEDNPVYMATGYRSKLQALPEPLRSMMLFGDHQVGREEAENQICPTEWVRIAQDRWLIKFQGKRPIEYPLSTIGADIARGGAANTVFVQRYWEFFAEPHIHAGKDTKTGRKVAKLLFPLIEENCTINLDILNVGYAAMDALARDDEEADDEEETTMLIKTLEEMGVVVNPVNMSVVTAEMDETGIFKFANFKSMAWWRFREALNPETGQDLALPPGRLVIQDLCAPTFEVQMNGIAIEPKKKIMDRLGRSIDVGDAIILASLVPDVQQSSPATAGKNESYDTQSVPNI